MEQSVWEEPGQPGRGLQENAEGPDSGSLGNEGGGTCPRGAGGFRTDGLEGFQFLPLAYQAGAIEDDEECPHIVEHGGHDRMNFADGAADHHQHDKQDAKEEVLVDDARAIRFCGDLLLKRSEARRILFVLTDGDGDVEMARANVDTLERLGVTVIGIGIGLDVSKVYPNNIRVNDATALAAASFKQIKLAIH